MKFYLTLNSGREVEIEVLEQGPGRARLLVDDREIEADFRDVDRLGQYAVGIDGRSYAASIEQHSETDLGVTIAGESFRVQAVDERERAAGELAASRPKAETILASMPGIVVAVHIEVGQILAPGDPVLVLEAMKMQNEICSEHGGVVQEVLVSAGENVAGNEVLVKLAPAEAAE
jgi:biotin carboxyl carrier protein